MVFSKNRVLVIAGNRSVLRKFVYRNLCLLVYGMLPIVSIVTPVYALDLDGEVEDNVDIDDDNDGILDVIEDVCTVGQIDYTHNGVMNSNGQDQGATFDGDASSSTYFLSTGDTSFGAGLDETTDDFAFAYLLRGADQATFAAAKSANDYAEIQFTPNEELLLEQVILGYFVAIDNSDPMQPKEGPEGGVDMFKIAIEYDDNPAFSTPEVLAENIQVGDLTSASYSVFSTGTVNLKLAGNMPAFFRFYFYDEQNSDSFNRVNFDDLMFPFSVTSSCDLDSDGFRNSNDLDSDNDGIPDNVEAQATEDYVQPLFDDPNTTTVNEADTDGNGLNDAYETTPGAGVGLTLVNTDGVDQADFLDLDSDNDGTFDIVESGQSLSQGATAGRVDPVTVGINGLANDAAAENADDFGDVNGLAHDSTNFTLSDTDNDTAADGSNAATTVRDLDYRDDTAPIIVLDSVTADNLINAAEASADVQVTGTVSGDYSDGDTVTLVVNGNTYTGDVDVSGVYSINVLGADLVADTTIDASVVASDVTGFTGVAAITATHSADVDAAAPVVKITDDSDDNGIISIAELSGNVDVTVTLPVNAVAGDTITVSDGVTTIPVVLTTGDITASNVVASFAVPADGDTITVSATLTDAVGNVSDVASDSATIDTTEAVLTPENPGVFSSSTPIFSGTSDQADGRVVTVKDDQGNTLCAATVAAGVWSCQSTVELPYGTVNLIAETTDIAGNPTALPFTVTIEIDTDGDGVVNSLDLDDDNDGIPDLVEEAGNPDRDTDDDGITDSLDLDSDNDGIPDIIEAGGVDVNADGKTDEQMDINGDGIDDAVAIAPLEIADTDNDGIADFLDLDSDNDGVPDIVETQGVSADVDFDGKIDDFVDVNADGIDDSVAFAPALIDDLDEDGVPNYLDLDSDGDGIFDLLESGGTDADNNGIQDSLVDADSDGIPDSVDVDFTGGVDADGDNVDDIADASVLGGSDQDGDGIIDGLDPDANGDGLADNGRLLLGGALPDLDNNGVADLFEQSGVIQTGVSGHGCSISGVNGQRDLTLLTLLLIAIGMLGLRYKIRRY